MRKDIYMVESLYGYKKTLEISKDDKAYCRWLCLLWRLLYKSYVIEDDTVLDNSKWYEYYKSGMTSTHVLSVEKLDI